jgi:hypothetical protein
MRLVYTRERKYIGTKWSRVTCLALPLAATLSLGSRALEDSQSHRCLTIATGNKQLQINKQYIKQYQNSNQIVSKYSTHHYECVSVRIT